MLLDWADNWMDLSYLPNVSSKFVFLANFYFILLFWIASWNFRSSTMNIWLLSQHNRPFSAFRLQVQIIRCSRCLTRSYLEPWSICIILLELWPFSFTWFRLILVHLTCAFLYTTGLESIGRSWCHHCFQFPMCCSWWVLVLFCLHRAET